MSILVELQDYAEPMSIEEEHSKLLEASFEDVVLLSGVDVVEEDEKLVCYYSTNQFDFSDELDWFRDEDYTDC